ncbi:MAG: zf-HC2 domain-containing protein, partial [Chloroflexota bacterium]|nr:zf-HC2 domain-containing protein [Chloroflexota bacterium]
MGPHPEYLLSAYVDDALDAAERARVAAHLAACGLCASRARELSATAGLLRALPDPRPSRSLVP